MREIKVQTAMLLANTLYQKCGDGASLNTKFETPQDGFMVSIVDGPVFPNPLNVDVLDVKEFILKQWNPDEKMFFGVWTDEKDGRIYFDLSINTPDKEWAIQQGKLEGQIAIWDVANAKEIRIEQEEIRTVQINHHLSPQRVIDEVNKLLRSKGLWVCTTEDQDDDKPESVAYEVLTRNDGPIRITNGFIE